MQHNKNIANKNYAVIGLGDTGLSIIKYLLYKGAKNIKVFDTRDNPPNTDKIKGLPLKTGALEFRDFIDIDTIVISPGVSIYEEALKSAITSGKEVVGDIELFAREINNWQGTKIIGITGSNGKSTVTALTGHLLKTYGKNTLVAGNIGTPVLDSYVDLATSGDIPQAIVLELSSFQLETVYSLNLDAATVLNISEDHLDRYRDLLEYAYAKDNIFNNCKLQVLNYDDIIVKAMYRSNKEALWFGDKSINRVEEGSLYIDDKPYLACAELNLVGRHNYFNSLVSILLASAVGVDIYAKSIKDALKSFAGLEHRMQKVSVHNGVTFVEDSKGTNVGATVAGVSGLNGSVHLILGGDGKGQNFSPLRAMVEAQCSSVAVIGKDKAAIIETLAGLKIPVKICATLPEAVELCYSLAKTGEYVVLSPACASWDMFDNYKHRAQVFIESVHALSN